MKISALSTLSLFAVTVCGHSRDFAVDRNDQAVLSGIDLAVPGDNPLAYCEDPSDNILNIHGVDIDPNPPQAGDNLTFTASGTFSETIEAGATVHLQVKYGVITILRQEADLCETVKEVGLECPLEKGDMTLTKSVELPKTIPPGKYTVHADVRTKDDKRITCLNAAVQFARTRKALGLW